MSFLIDPPWLYANGRACGAITRDPRKAAAAGAAIVGAFWAVSIPLYANRRWTRPIWEACGAEDGRDWMLNSGILRVDHRGAGPGTHAAAAALFASYPLWLWLGWQHGRR